MNNIKKTVMYKANQMGKKYGKKGVQINASMYTDSSKLAQQQFQRNIKYI